MDEYFIIPIVLEAHSLLNCQAYFEALLKQKEDETPFGDFMHQIIDINPNRCEVVSNNEYPIIQFDLEFPSIYDYNKTKTVLDMHYEITCHDLIETDWIREKILSSLCDLKYALMLSFYCCIK
jgi:hypothetical protein